MLLKFYINILINFFNKILFNFNINFYKVNLF